MLKQKLEKLGFEFSDTWETSSGYLLEDGSFLHLSNQKPLPESRIRFHAMLDRFIVENNLIENIEDYPRNTKLFEPGRPRFLAVSNDRLLRYTDNACTINDGTAFTQEGVFIDLPPKMPQGKQLDQLILWIDYLHYRNPPFGKTHLDVSLEKEVRSFNLEEDSTDEIIKEIKRLYNNI